MAILNLEKRFNPQIIQAATKALIQDIYFGNRQALLDFLDHMDADYPQDIEDLSTSLGELHLTAEDCGISPDIWHHYYHKSPLALLRQDIQIRKNNGLKPETILNDNP